MYTRELRLNLQPLLAACLGMGLGSALHHYTMSLFGPALIDDLGWSRADFALITSLSLINLFILPFVGWFVDRFGTRWSAAVGFTALVLGYLALASMSGSIIVFFVIVVVKNMFGGLTATLVFCRVVVQRFDAARGVALALVMTASPLGSAIAVPLLGELIDEYGWRAGYRAMACLAAIGGAVSIALMERQQRPAGTEAAPAVSVSWDEVRRFLRNPVLLLILAGVFLINVPQVFASSQLKLIALDKGTTGEVATWLISLYATGVIVGRFLCGLALDRFEPHIVAVVALGLPTIGFLLFFSPAASISALAFAVLLIGLAQGAEGDIGAYLLSRRFSVANFSLLLSLMTAMLAAGSAVGSLVLSFTLRLSNDYNSFLLLAAGTTLVGAACFAITGSRSLQHSTLGVPPAAAANSRQTGSTPP